MKLAFLLSIVPGLGQAYFNKTWRGIEFFLGWVLCLFVSYLGAIADEVILLFIGLILGFGVWIWGIYDAYKIQVKA